GLARVFARRRPLEPQLDRLLRAVRDGNPNADLRRVETAYRFADTHHQGQKRKSGEEFINHPVAVTELLAEMRMDTATLEAALLHDVVEDTPVTLEEITEVFGEDVAFLIDGVTKIDALTLHSREAQQAETLRKMMLATAKDLRVILIKLCDRLHNMKTIHPLSAEKQERKATETLEVYAPIAHRLGIHKIKWQLEDLSFKILYPQQFSELHRMVEERQPERARIVDEVLDKMNAALSEQKIKAQLSGRPKHYWSIYQKMRMREREFGDIYDLIGIRVVVPDIRDCYGALGTVHQLWKPIPGRFKDYIAMPKLNGYRSLHTVVAGPGGREIEVQIRSEEMNQLAEYGVAAHWKYKDPRAKRTPEEDLAWVRQMMEWQQDAEDPGEFLERLRVDLYQDEVFVFTPKGEVRAFPRGATAIDFAYAIHTDVGHRCVGARVNGRLAPLGAQLRSGDVVEIITSRSPGAGPSRDWLGYAKTNRARSKIRHWFSRERREEAQERGRDELVRAIRRSGLPIQATLGSDTLQAVARELGHESLEALEAAIGEGHLQATTVVQRLEHEVADDEDILAPAIKPSRLRRPSDSGIVVPGLDSALVRLAKCCTPVPGDPVVGFVTRGRGVSVHRADCPNIGALGEEEERMLEVGWADAVEGAFSVAIVVRALDRTRLLRDVTETLSDLGVNITESQTHSDRRAHQAALRFTVELPDATHLDTVLSALRRIDGVFDADRVVPRSAR
ncbi:MAG: RelA/SpoT family protein, partial [Actinomycetota bacterium]